jgi:hypothetical protein
MTSGGRLFPVRRALLLLPLRLAAACGSDNSYESVDEYRSEAVRPERQVPEGLAEMREDMQVMRDETLAVLDQVMGGSPDDTGYWYTPVFDAIDFALSWTRWLVP